MQVSSTSSAAGPVSVIPSVFETVQGYKVPFFFSRYPAGISIAARDVEDALRKIDEEASEKGQGKGVEHSFDTPTPTVTLSLFAIARPSRTD